MKNILSIFLILTIQNLYAETNQYSAIDFENIDEDKLLYDATLKGTLTKEDYETLEVGYISTTQYVVGGILGTYPGLGIGHAVQGRWKRDGWKFTAGQLGSVLVLALGFGQCVDDAFFAEDCDGTASALISVGVAGIVGFRIWEIIDVWATRGSQNNRFKQIYYKTYKTIPKDPKVSFFVLPELNFKREKLGLNFGLSF